MWPLLGLALVLVGLAAWGLLRRRPARVEVTPLAAVAVAPTEQWMLPTPQALPDTFLAAAPRLLPRVRNAAWLALDDLEREVRGFPRSPVPHRVVAGDLVAEVAWNGHAVDEAALARWGATFEEALEAALDNLGAAASGGFAETADGERGAWAAASNDGSDGARVLLPELLGALGLQGTAVAVVPTDGAFIVADMAQPRGLQTLVRLAEAALRSRKAVPVSATFLVLQDGAWAKWEGDRYAATPDVMRRLRETLLLRLHGRQKFLLEKRGAGTAVPEGRGGRRGPLPRLQPPGMHVDRGRAHGPARGGGGDPDARRRHAAGRGALGPAAPRAGRPAGAAGAAAGALPGGRVPLRRGPGHAAPDLTGLERHGQEGHGDGAHREAERREVGQEADQRRPHEQAEVAGGGHSGDADPGAETSDAPRGAEEHGHRVGEAQPHEPEADQRGRDVAREHQEHAQEAEGAAGPDQALGVVARAQGVPGEATHGHGEGEGGEAPDGPRLVGEEAEAQVEGAPVAHGALGQQAEEGEDAQAPHGGVREGEERGVGGLGGVVGEEPGEGDDGGDQAGPGDGEGVTLRVEGDEEGGQGGPDQRAQAEEGVEGGHEGAAGALLHEHGLGVHGHVHGADAGAEEQQESDQEGQGGGGHHRSEREAEGGGGDGAHAGAAEAGDEAAREDEGEDRPGGHGQEDGAQDALGEVEAVAERGNARSPRGQDDPVDAEEGEDRRPQGA